MEVNPCSGCVSSCCALLIDLTKKEYLHLKSLNLKNNLLKQSEIFTDKNPIYKGKEEFLDSMYEEEFAIIKKGKDGFCSLLNRETRLCGIYEKRPKCCRDYESNGKQCKKIKKCIN